MPIIKSIPSPIGPGDLAEAWHGGCTLLIDTLERVLRVRVLSYADRATAYDPGKLPVAGREITIAGDAYDAHVAAHPELFAALVAATDAVLLAHPDYAGGVQVPPGPEEA